jgi:hypothetical protein
LKRSDLPNNRHKMRSKGGFKLPNEYGEKDWLDTALPLINSLEIIDADADGEVLNYALVENTKENRDTLKQAGVTDEEIEEALECYEHSIDLTTFVWKFAKWFNGDKFVREKPFDDM